MTSPMTECPASDRLESIGGYAVEAEALLADVARPATWGHEYRQPSRDAGFWRRCDLEVVRAHGWLDLAVRSLPTDCSVGFAVPCATIANFNVPGRRRAGKC